MARPVNAVQAIEGRAQPRYRPTFLKGAVVLLAVVAILPTRANGQFGIDTAAIMAALSKMQSLMNTYIASPLRTINQYEQSTAKYEQEVMYPLTAINWGARSRIAARSSDARAYPSMTGRPMSRTAISG